VRQIDALQQPLLRCLQDAWSCGQSSKTQLGGSQLKDCALCIMYLLPHIAGKNGGMWPLPT
jgi:hypothetical protein